MSSPFQKSFSSKTPLQIRKANSTKRNIPKKPGVPYPQIPVTKKGPHIESPFFIYAYIMQCV